MKKQITALFVTLVAISTVQAKAPSSYEELGNMTVFEFVKPLGPLSRSEALQWQRRMIEPMVENKWGHRLKPEVAYISIGLEKIILDKNNIITGCANLERRKAKMRAKLEQECNQTIREKVFIPVEEGLKRSEAERRRREGRLE